MVFYLFMLAKRLVAEGCCWVVHCLLQMIVDIMCVVCTDLVNRYLCLISKVLVYYLYTGVFLPFIDTINYQIKNLLSYLIVVDACIG